MNVEWKCPDCGSRLFAPPRGTPGWLPYKCRLHTDTLMEQVEDFEGPNFSWLDEDEIDPRKTGVQTIGVNLSRVTPAEDVVKKVLDPDAAVKAEIEHLQRQYTQVTSGKKPHSQWRAPRLRKEIEQAEQQLNDRLEYYSLVDRYNALTGEMPSEQWGLTTLKSNLKRVEKEAEQEKEDA